MHMWGNSSILKDGVRQRVEEWWMGRISGWKNYDAAAGRSCNKSWLHRMRAQQKDVREWEDGDVIICFATLLTRHEVPAGQKMNEQTHKHTYSCLWWCWGRDAHSKSVQLLILTSRSPHHHLSCTCFPFHSLIPRESSLTNTVCIR